MRDKNIALIESEVLRVLEAASFQIYKDLNFSDVVEEIADDFQVIASLPEALRQAGLEDLFNKIQDGYADDLEFIEDILKAQKLPPLADIDRQAIAVIIDADMSVLRGRFQSYNADLAQSLTRNVLTGEAPDFNVLTANMSKRAASNIITEYNTALSGLSSTVNVKKAKELYKDPKMIYRGPLDKLTRPFCQQHTGKIYTIKEIESMDNGQGLPVLEYNGGYNCRHEWVLSLENE